MSKSHFRYTSITKIERRACNRPVFNIAVEEDESYVADGVVVHNCRSLLVPVTADIPLDERDRITQAELGRATALTPDRFGGRGGPSQK